MAIGFDMAALVGFGCEAFFYGCYTILFALAIYLKLYGPNRNSDVKGPLFIISVFLYLSCSTQFALEFSHFYKALNSTGVEGFAMETNDVIGAGILVAVSNFFGELIIIYRCWVLWSKNYWVIFLPSLAAISFLVCTSEAFHLFLQKNFASSETLGHATFIVSVCVNATVTTLIVIRIWYLSPHKRHDMLPNFPTGTGRAAIAIVVESGMLYLSVQLVYCILYAIGHPAQYILMGIAPQIYGIAPTLIFIRMSGLLSAPPSPNRSGAAVTQLGDSATGLHIAINMPKPSGGDLGSVASATTA